MSIINPYPLCVSQMLCRNPVDDYVGGDEDYQRVPPVSVGRMDGWCCEKSFSSQQCERKTYRVMKNLPLLHVLSLLFVRMSRVVERWWWCKSWLICTSSKTDVQKLYPSFVTDHIFYINIYLYIYNSLMIQFECVASLLLLLLLLHFVILGEAVAQWLPVDNASILVWSCIVKCSAFK